MKKYPSLLFVSAFASLGASSASAAIISADSFLTGGSDYTAGGDLNGQTASATGFSGSWTANTNFDVSSGGLSFTNAAGSNNTLTSGGGSVIFGPTTSTTNVSAQRAATNPGTSALYASFLVRSDANSQTGSMATLALGNLRLAGMLNGNVFAYSDGTETQGSAFSVGKTYLFVLKITPNASGTIDYINTWYFNTDSTQDLSVADPTVGTNSSIAGSFVSANSGTGPNFITGTGIWQNSGTIGFMARGQASGWTTGNLSMDELRVGGSWADVVPVAIPEPSAFAALFGLGALAVAASRRRRAV